VSVSVGVECRVFDRSPVDPAQLGHHLIDSFV
jgi:hypothetical protein